MLSKPLLLAGVTFVAFLTVQNGAFASNRISNGGGGYYDQQGNLYSYEFEIWTDDTNTEYTLRVWESADYPNGPQIRPINFSSAREALDYFDCNYSQKEDVCDQMNHN